jgi:hypothetical protein
MSPKTKFSLYSALTMSLIPILGLYISIPYLSMILSWGFVGPASVLVMLFKLPHLSGDNPIYYYSIGFVLWFILGWLWGYLLYYIRNKNSTKQIKFGFGAFITTKIVQIGVSTLIVYLLVFILNYLGISQ